MRFREVFYRLVPGWLSNGDGEKVLYSLGLMQDTMAERFRLSYEADLPEYAPDDALTYIGRDRRIVRGINESSAAYADRLIRYLDDHRTQGNPFALMDQLYAYLQTSGVRLRTVDRRGNWFSRAADGTQTFSLDNGDFDWDGGALSSWARFWVIIDSSSGPWETQWDPTVEGSFSGTTTATADEIAGVMSLIREWKPVGTRCEYVIVNFDEDAFDQDTAATGYWHFDGVDQYINFGNVAALDFDSTDARTVTYWVRSSSPSWGTHLGKWSGAATRVGWVTRGNGASGVPRFEISNNYPTDSLVMDGASSVEDGDWHFVAWTYDGSLSPSGVLLRVDGASSALTTTVDTLTGASANAFNVNVGATNFGAASLYEGDIADVNVWASVLTPTQLDAIAALPRGTSLSAYAPLLSTLPAGDTYPTATDHGTGGNDGTMTNMDAGDITDDVPAGAWGDWSEDGRPVRFAGARYWRGPR